MGGHATWTIWRLQRLQEEILTSGVFRYAGWFRPTFSLNPIPGDLDASDLYAPYLVTWRRVDFKELLYVRARLNEWLCGRARSGCK